MPSVRGASPFPTTLETLKALLTDEPPGNRWVKVNLHVHGEGHDPEEVVRQARAAEVDLIAITDHQTFRYYDSIAEAAAGPGRRLVVLPGIEITALEGAHLLALFPLSYSPERRSGLCGWLEIDGSGDTRVASRRNVHEILLKVENDEGGLLIAPHPFAEKIGLLDGARKISTKMEWLESGHIRLFQVSETTKDKVKYIGHDEDGNWINRFVLTSANKVQISGSRYCLAPFKRSDAHSPDEIADGCSWFRMQELSVEGLKQVACEPRTRISWDPPPPAVKDRILGLVVHGGYCRGQLFRINDGLNSLIGPNHAGKSTVLDLIRFAIGHERCIRADPQENLLARLNATLGAGGSVELYLRRNGAACVIRREFVPEFMPGPNPRVKACIAQPIAYRYDEQGDQLLRDQEFDFPVEVYEQGRIHDLRNDMNRQLEMLDEFAGLGELKSERDKVIKELNVSAAGLAPPHEEQEQLKSELSELPTLKAELTEKTAILPGKEEDKWAKAEAFVATIEGLIEELDQAAVCMPDPTNPAASEAKDMLQALFGQRLPDLDSAAVVEPKVLAQWGEFVRAALKDIEAARRTILAAVNRLNSVSQGQRKAWAEAKSEHDRCIAERLKEAGLDSPQELIERVSELRVRVHDLEEVKQPRLREVNRLIKEGEKKRGDLLRDLQRIGGSITATRKEKAEDLTAALGEHVRIDIEVAGHREAYFQTLDRLTTKPATGGVIKNREAQLKRVVDNILPIDLARAVARGGRLDDAEGQPATLQQICGITHNTESVLCDIAKDIRRLNELTIVEVADVPHITVRRRGETSFADLRTGLSPGEQSAAILTLALHTRAAPLILDQPEDELGYSYVVHLIVPKIL